jgi:hypothetical protein
MGAAVTSEFFPERGAERWPREKKFCPKEGNGNAHPQKEDRSGGRPPFALELSLAESKF